MEKAILYRRISTNKKKQDIDRQLKPLQQYCKNNGLEIICGDGFKDEISGSIPSIDREGYQELIKFIENYDGDKSELNIVFDEVTRLGRKVKDIINQIDWFTQQKINCRFLSPELSYLDKNKEVGDKSVMTVSIFAAFAEEELKRITHRVKTGFKRVAEKGHWTGGNKVTYGYMNDNKMFAINSKEAKIVKKIFKMYASGKGSPTIANYLNAHKVPTRLGGLWTISSITTMLRNRCYFGERKVQGKIYECPAIIDKELFDKVRTINNNKTNYATRMGKYTNPLIRKVYCTCGEPAFLSIAADGGLKYKCNSVAKQQSCHQFNQISCDKLINSVATNLNSLMSKINNNKNLMKNLNDELKQINDIDLPIVENKLSMIEERKDKVNMMFEMGNYAVEKYKERFDEIVNEEKAFKAQIKNFKSQSKDIVNQIKTLSNKKDVEVITMSKFKLFAKDYIKKITLTRTDEVNDIRHFKANEIVVKVNIEFNISEVHDYYYYLANYTRDLLLEPLTEFNPLSREVKVAHLIEHPIKTDLKIVSNFN